MNFYVIIDALLFPYLHSGEDKSEGESGQGLVEYALILVLVAVVVIGALAILGPQIGGAFSDLNEAIPT